MEIKIVKMAFRTARMAKTFAQMAVRKAEMKVRKTFGRFGRAQMALKTAEMPSEFCMFYFVYLPLQHNVDGFALFFQFWFITLFYDCFIILFFSSVLQSFTQLEQ